MNKLTLMILYLITKVFATCHTRYYENDLYSRYGDFPESGCTRRYVDIYTNYPDLPTTLNNYDIFRKYGEKYVYPSSSNDRRVFNDYYETTNIDKADVDELESEFGEFQDTTDPHSNEYEHRNEVDVESSRPEFETQIHKDLYKSDEDEAELQNDRFGSVYRVPRYNNSTVYRMEKNKQPDDTDADNAFRDWLKKYAALLYRKRVGTKADEPDKEPVEPEEDLAENIETLEDAENIYLHIDEHDKLPVASTTTTNSSKILDSSFVLALKNKTAAIKNKLLSLFTVVRFPNTGCIAADSSQGTCYHLAQCTNLNGTATGTCANGYGVCCVFRGSCGGSSNHNCTYFENPGYPNYYPPNSSLLPPPPPSNGTIDPRLVYQVMKFLARQDSTGSSLSCTFNVFKSSNTVRQLRIDFLDLELRSPTNGSCVDERLVIMGQNSNDVIPPICGYNTGQHILVDVSETSGPISVAVLSNLVERKRFRLRICQISECTSPANCLQYYTGVTGTISSFNYDQLAAQNRSRPSYFNNLNYAVCIRKEAGYCSITYTNAQGGVMYPFQLVNVDSTGLSTTPPGQAGAEIFSCPNDYIVVNGIRLCGDRLNDGSVSTDFTMNAPVTDTSGGPFVLPVRTNSNGVGRGFKLFYTQNRCPGTA